MLFHWSNGRSNLGVAFYILCLILICYPYFKHFSVLDIKNEPVNHLLLMIILYIFLQVMTISFSSFSSEILARSCNFLCESAINTVSSVYPIMLRLRSRIIYLVRAFISLRMAKEVICEEDVSLSTNKKNDSGNLEESLERLP